MANRLAWLLAASTAVALVQPALAQENLVNGSTVGDPDAPNTLVLRLTGDGPGNNDPEIAEQYELLYSDFVRQHPEWKLEMQLMSGNIGQEQARMLEQARAGRAPDCAAVDSFVLSQFMENDVLKSFSPYFSQDEIDQLFPFIRDGITGEDGDIYAWWWNTDLRVLYRNQEVLPDAPQTWEATREAALQTVEAGKEGILFNGGRWEGTTFDWLANFWAQDGDLVDDEGKPIFGEGENREKFLNAVNYYKDLVDSGAAPARVANIADYDDFNAAAAAGTTALFVGGNWQLAQLEATMPEEEFAKWTFSPLPGPTEDQRSTGTGGWTFASFSDDEEKVEMCANFVREVYMGPANALQQQLPTRADLYDEYEVFSTPANQTFAAALADGRARPGAPIYPEISNQIQVMMGDVLSGTKDPEQALDDAFAAAMEGYERQ